MRTLLRHALTGQYYRSTGKWTANPSQAHDFRLVASAMKFVRGKRCRNLELDLSFDDPRVAASFCLKDLFAES